MSYVCLNGKLFSTSQEECISIINSGGKADYTISHLDSRSSHETLNISKLIVSNYTSNDNLFHFMYDTFLPVLNMLENIDNCEHGLPDIYIYGKEDVAENDSSKFSSYFWGLLMKHSYVRKIHFTKDVRTDIDDDIKYVYNHIIPAKEFSMASKKYFKGLLMKEFKFDNAPKSRILVLDRRITRRIINVNEAIQMNTQHDIEIIYLEELSMYEQIEIFFRKNQILIGVHGAGLSWISIMCLFENTICIELVFGKWTGFNTPGGYWFAPKAKELGMNFSTQYMIGNRNILPQNTDENRPNVNDNIIVNWSQMCDFLSLHKSQ